MSRCMPLAPFRFWRYSKTDDSIPLWVAQYLCVQPSGAVEFNFPNNGNTLQLEDGWVVVRFDDDEDVIAVYAADEFERQFRAVAEEGSVQT